MIVQVTTDEALLIAALDKVTSKDKSRSPVLGAIFFEWETGEVGTLTLEATVTDSYILASRRLVILSDQYTTGFEGDIEGSTLVNGREFVDAVKAVTKTIPKTLKGKLPVILDLPDDGTTVGVTADFPGAPTYQLRVVEGAFPKWRQLFKDQKPEHDGRMPAFSPHHMTRLLQAMAATPAGLKGGTPFTFTSGGSALKPFGVVREEQGVSKFTGLIMPVRV